MDILSHALVGSFSAKLIAKEKNKKIYSAFWGSIMPDLFQIPIYIYLGYLNNRFLFFPLAEDWLGVRESNPILLLLWELPHSLLLVGFIFLIFLLFKKYYLYFFGAWFLHIIIDIFTHSGEWALKIFYPFDFQIEGITNAWSWPVWGWGIAWLSFIGFFYFINKKMHTK